MNESCTFLISILLLLQIHISFSLEIQCNNSTNTYQLLIDNFIVSFNGASPSFEVKSSNTSTPDQEEFYINIAFNTITERESTGENGEQYDFPQNFLVECFETWYNETIYSNSTDTNETISFVSQINITFTATLPNSAILIFQAVINSDNSTLCYYPDTCFNLSQDAVQASMIVKEWKFKDPQARLVVTSTVSTSAGALTLSASYYDDGTPQNLYIPSPYDFIVLHLSEYAQVWHYNSTELDYEKIGIDNSVKDLSPVSAEVILSLPPNNNTQKCLVPLTINQESDAPSPTNWIAIILGGVFGVLCFVVLIIVVIVIYKKNQGKSSKLIEEDSTSMESKSESSFAPLTVNTTIKRGSKWSTGTGFYQANLNG